MQVLVFNCGSSTLKFDLFRAETPGSDAGPPPRLAHGLVDGIGREGVLAFETAAGSIFQERATLADQGTAVRRVLQWLESEGSIGPGGVDAVGHRVVHGGDLFREPARINEEVLAAIEEVTELAPLHNRPALGAIRAAREVLGAAVPMVAIFDTAFHRTMPEVASRYAIPRDLAERQRIRRYGFHGIAHQYLAERYAALADPPKAAGKLITLQLGNGCSAAAIASGRSIDTSMGLTPLEGLVMGTRSGDVDPSLAGFLARKEGVTVEEVEGWLNRNSGLLGVSGRSPDMRELIQAAEQGDPDAGLAIDLFCYRIRKYIGAYLAVLGGADAVVFGGGIGENAPTIRERVCAGMDWCGLVLDPARNFATVGTGGRISVDTATMAAYVIPVDEAAVMVQGVLRCLVAGW